MLLGANLLFPEKKGGIPSGWVEVKWLETDGASWIDTKVECLAVETELALRIQKSALSVNHVSVGARNIVYLAWIDGTNRLLNYASSASSAMTPVWNGFADVVSMMNLNGSSLSFNGETVTGRRGIIGFPSYHYALFAAACTGESHNGNYFRSPSGERIASALFRQNGKAVASFVPVRNATTGEGAMCDIITGEIYHNAGTGSFIVGPDKGAKTASDYIQDGIVAMWDGIENAGWGVHDESATYWTELVSGLRMSALSDSYYQPSDRYGSFTHQCTQTIPKELWGGDHVKNITQSALVDMDSVASNAFFTLLYCYASPAAYRYGISTNASRRLTGDHLTMLSVDDSALYTHGIHRFDHVVTENTSGGTDEKLYIDGVEIVSARKTTAFSATETTQMRFYFFENIRAYNMMHYNRVLTPAEIAANYAIDKARFGI